LRGFGCCCVRRTEHWEGKRERLCGPRRFPRSVRLRRLGARDVPKEAGDHDVADDFGEGSELQRRRQVADQRRLNGTAAPTHRLTHPPTARTGTQPPLFPQTHPDDHARHSRHALGTISLVKLKKVNKGVVKDKGAN